MTTTPNNIDVLSFENDFSQINSEDLGLFSGWTQFKGSKSHQTIECLNYTIKEQEDDFLEIDNSDDIIEKALEKKKEIELFKKFASFEFLGHFLGYQNLKNKPIQNILEMDGSVKEYRCTYLETDNIGLVPKVYAPTSMENRDVANICMSFQGTDPSCLASVLRDLEPGGAGSKSFARNLKSMLSQFCDVLGKFQKEINTQNKPLQITIAGHSLGGADTKNMIVAFMYAIAEAQGITVAGHEEFSNTLNPEQKKLLCEITKIIAAPIKGAGVPQKTADLSDTLAGLLAEQRNKGNSKLEVELYRQITPGDGVSQTGEGDILNNSPAEHAKVIDLKTHIGNSGRQVFSTAGAIATVAVGGALGLAAVATSAALGIKDMAIAHTAHLFNAPREVQYETMENGMNKSISQNEGYSEFNRKCWSLNTAHQAAAKVANVISSGADFCKSSLDMLFGFNAKNTQKEVVAAAPKALAGTLASSSQSNTKKAWYRWSRIKGCQV